MNFIGAPRRTIKDVAREAGVSVTTVSNVLNGHVEAMSPATLARVRGLIASLNYEPSAVARSLVSGRQAVVALTLRPLPAPISAESVAALQTRLRSAGRELVILAEGQSTVGFDACEAVILAGPAISQAGDKSESMLQTAGRVVTVGAKERQAGYFNVDIDVDRGVQIAVAHLAQQGHTSLGWLACTGGNALGAQMRDAFGSALLLQGTETNARWCEPVAGRDRESVRRWARDLIGLRFRPSAVIAEDDILGALLLREAQTAGLRVPGDLAVVGFGDQTWCEWTSPRLTSVSIPLLKGLEMAIDLVLGHLSAAEGGQLRVELGTELVQRDSSGPPRRGSSTARALDSGQSTLW